MAKKKILSVDEFIGANGEDFFVTDFEDLPRPTVLDSFSIIDTDEGNDG